MPFHTPSQHQEFKPSGTPIQVVAAFNPLGDIKPIIICLQDMYGNVCKAKITEIKYTKDLRIGIGRSFCCLYLAGEQQKECTINFYYNLARWYLET